MRYRASPVQLNCFHAGPLTSCADKCVSEGCVHSFLELSHVLLFCGIVDACFTMWKLPAREYFSSTFRAFSKADASDVPFNALVCGCLVDWRLLFTRRANELETKRLLWRIDDWHFVVEIWNFEKHNT